MADSINSSGKVPYGSGTHIPSVGAGDVIRPANFNKLAEGIDRATPKSGRGVRVSNLPGGSIISIPNFNFPSHPFKAFAAASSDVKWLAIKLGNIFSPSFPNTWKSNNSVPWAGVVAYDAAPLYEDGYHAQGSEIFIDVKGSNYISSKHIGKVPLLMPAGEGLYYIEIGHWSGKQITATDAAFEDEVADWNQYSKDSKGAYRPIIKYAKKDEMVKLPDHPTFPICTIDRYGRIFQCLSSDLFIAGVEAKPFNVTVINADSDKTFIVSIGTVNRIVPKLDGLYLDADTRPEMSFSGSGYVFLKCTYEEDTFFPRNAEVIFDTTISDKVDTLEESYRPIARINEVGTGANKVYRVEQMSSGNLIVNRVKAGENNAFWMWHTERE